MGWYYEAQSRAELIRELLTPQAGQVLRESKDAGDHLWRLIQIDRDGTPATIIAVDLIGSTLHNGLTRWGYKPMDESMGVYLYDCPLSWLAESKAADWGRYSVAWREGVKAYHAARKDGQGNFQAANAAGRAAHDAATERAEQERQQAVLNYGGADANA